VAGNVPNCTLVDAIIKESKHEFEIHTINLLLSDHFSVLATTCRVSHQVTSAC